MKYLLILLALTGCATTKIEPKSRFIVVDQMNCPKVLKMFSKRQMSELNEEEKFVASGASECGIMFQHVRMLKSRIIAYSPKYSIIMSRKEKYADDVGGPLYIEKYNVESCELGVGEPGKTPTAWVVVDNTCKEIDDKLKD